MGKRHVSSLEKADSAQPSTKRPRHADQRATESMPTTAQDLEQLCVFRRDDALTLVHNLRKLRAFLGTVVRSGDAAERQHRRSILLDYLTRVSSGAAERRSTAIPPLFEAWVFAAETSRGDLLSAIPSFLVSLLSTISGLIEFREVGVQLCYSVLTRDSLRSLDKSLESHSPKDNPTAPCLRLLTEVVSFDGGACARAVYNHRHVTWRRLPWLLSKREDSKRPSKRAVASSVRCAALSYVLANLRLQSLAAKEDLISIPSLFSNLFKHISHDPPNLVKETLDTVRDSIVLNKNVSLALKGHLFSEGALASVATLYKYRASEDSGSGLHVRSCCHEFLRLVCTSTKYGILEPPAWPPETRRDGGTVISSIPLADSRAADGPIRNSSAHNQIVVAFLQTLRPHADLKQRELLLAVLEAAPEIIADYFVAKQSTSLEPALTATWLGHAALVASVQKLACSPVHKTFQGRHVSPPHTSIVLQSILPEPWTKTVLTKCLNQSCLLIRLLALNLIIGCLRKTSTVLDSYQAGKRTAEWDNAAKDLIVELSSRLPEMKHLVSNFRGCPAENSVLRQAFSAALCRYVQVVPEHALQSTFDISVTIAEALLPPPNRPQSRLAFRQLELADYLGIAYQSTEMRWWNGPEKLRHSPFVAVLRGIVTSKSRFDFRSRIALLLRSVAIESHVLQQDNNVDSFGGLVRSLQEVDGWQPSDLEFDFLDHCAQRIDKRPLKYAGDLRLLLADCDTEAAGKTTSLLLIAFVEQWPYLVDRNSIQKVEHCAQWLSGLLQNLADAGEDRSALRRAKTALSNNRSTFHPEDNLQKATTALNGEFSEAGQSIEFEAGPVCIRSTPVVVQDTGRDEPFFDADLDGESQPPKEPSDHPGLHRWQKHSMDDAADDGSLADLILCLASSHDEVRRQAIVNVRLCMSRLQALRHREMEQTYVLLGELVETVHETGGVEPLPSFAVVLAAQASRVLDTPLHCMFNKVNMFLNKAPKWDVSRLPSYWIDKILHQPPELADQQAQECEWLLDVLFGGLRRPQDLDLYRRCGVFERIMSLCSVQRLEPSCAERSIRLLYRCSCIGGSEMLITRCGVLAWIRERAAQSVGLRGLLRSLAARILNGCDAERLRSWSGLERAQLASTLFSQ